LSSPTALCSHHLFFFHVLIRLRSRDSARSYQIDPVTNSPKPKKMVACICMHADATRPVCAFSLPSVSASAPFQSHAFQTMSTTAHSVHQQLGQHEREPLLPGTTSSYPSSATIVEIQDSAASTANSGLDGSPKAHVIASDRLAHHREMVRERFSLNWWLEWTIIIVSDF